VTIEVKPPLNEATLEHFGVKGMKWGVRKERTPAEKRALAKKVAIGTGALLLIAGTAVVAHQMHKNGKLNFGSSSKTISAGKQAVDKILSEPTDVIHATRGHSKGFTFLKTGGTPSPLSVYENAFGRDTHSSDVFKKLADGKIAAGFDDPLGRRDAAGRVIPHQVVIPKSMAGGINNLDDVRGKIWPLIQEQYDAFHAGSIK
jgi:hypothetical protein